ncbi:restriction endonuclease [Chryseobacterium piscium]|uniref:Restriction endonuclease n=1 Tax=Chryseobacterium piscium TaxID=333702 RepID=A0A3D9BAQ3_9FLAO|nr:restriction endonuclease [Chryseobacterium piscium]REC50685.1 restriction endonuclease [Chryseobacterium piscium]
MGIFIREHIAYKLLLTNDFRLIEEKNKKYYLCNSSVDKIKPRKFKTERGKDYPCFSHKVSGDEVVLKSEYFVGLDWLTKDRFIHVEPKLNFSVVETFEKASDENKEDLSEEEIERFDKEAKKKIESENSYKEVNVIAMLMKIMSHNEVAKETDQLLLIDWEESEIEIKQKQDLLTPFLVVKFIKLLQDITRKGLKKSYYKVQENLRNRVKGKILVGQQIKQNVFKNRFTNTVCEYQVFGEDSIENQFLKKVFLFCIQYLENNDNYFKGENNITCMVNYIRPSFEQISSEVDIQDIKHLKYNPFFKEYKEAIKIGQQILKRFSYNITKTIAEKISTPPFWIDMPKMFELYVYARFLEDNPSLLATNFNYQFAIHGNSLDFLICAGDKKIVVDAKYKLKYNYSQIHEDIRQVAGYARLNKVREKLKYSDNEEIPCLIIYPKPIRNNESDKESLKIENIMTTEIGVYHKVFKRGVSLPIL